MFAAWFSQNGNGEMTGTTWIDEGGFMEGPVFITNTHSVGVVRDAAIAWSVKHEKTFQPWSLPVVAETWDGTLNDINGFHVKPEHVFAAIDGAARGPVAEGNVGGGTGMICYEFKCGTGTASRALPAQAGGYTVGVLVQANHGRRPELRMGGVPVGREIPVAALAASGRTAASRSRSRARSSSSSPPTRRCCRISSNASRAARRWAWRAPARRRATGPETSSWRSRPRTPASPPRLARSTSTCCRTAGSAPLFSATVEATEEAILNALVAAETMTGNGGNKVEAIPHERLRDILRR